MRRPDDTVILRPAAPPRRRGLGLALAAGLALLSATGATVWWLERPTPATSPATSPATPAAPPPAIPAAPAPEPIPLATEAAIAAESPAVRTVLRFGPNPAILVLDFPTLAEQGRTLNRLAAWAEKAGVPHDRLLPDAELAAAILRSGATPETYYYGHDYRGADILRFFALADRDAIPLRPEEHQLRALAVRAGAEPAGFGALISIPRADPANDTTPEARATILHHELSHGEYFTNPAYAAFVQTVWRTLLDDSERAAFRTYLSAEGYDPALEDLMQNEMQAYLMHTPDPRFFDPAKLPIPPARLAQIRASFLAGMPPGWLRNATPAHPRRRAPRRRPTRRQRPTRVSTASAVAATVPPRRRRASTAA